MVPPSYVPSNARPGLTPSVRPTRKVLAAGLLIVLAGLAVWNLLMQDEDGDRAYTGILASLSALKPGIASCPATCSPDYYASPGMIRWGAGDNETRWAVFSLPTDGCIADETTLRTAKLRSDPQAWAELGPHESHLAPSFMSYLTWLDGVSVDGSREGAEGDTSERPIPEHITAVVGRQVLFIGSSHDRNNVQFFCQHAHDGQYDSWGGHAGGSCLVPSLNLTIVHWFLYGMVDEDYDWYHQEEQVPVTFERRISEMMQVMAAERELIVQPDLVVVTSLFWDEVFMDQVYTKQGLTQPHANGYLYSDVKWHNQRLAELIRLVREMFGEDVPLMYRSRQIRATDYRRGLLKIFQLDQGNKDTAKRLGVKVYPWAELLEGYNAYYDKDQHFPDGPSTWLFGDITLFYLWQAVRGCWSCQRATTPAC